jgi:LA2681-like HEPN
MQDDNKEKIFDRLMSAQSLKGLSAAKALEQVGLLIDLSGDLMRDEGTDRALEWANELERGRVSASEAALLEYFRGNAWANRQKARCGNRRAVWAWEQPELQQEILHLRRAVQHEGFHELPGLRQCQIFTNLANQINTVGRFVEAQEYWRRALAIGPRFGMALGNRGYGLEQYARSLYDPRHRRVLLCEAHKSLSSALSDTADYECQGYDNAKAFFANIRDQIATRIDVERVECGTDLDRHEIGQSEEVCAYRLWCLTNTLFLNPLNDLGAHRIAARDILHLPSFVTPIDEPPALLGLFNQLKQEFVMARWLYYDGTLSDGIHFADRDVLLYNTLDYPAYSIAIEKVKAAYRLAYSLFDKIAFFLNAYLHLKFDESRVYFRSVWYVNADEKQGVRPELNRTENWPLRGLYWLAKDLFDKEFQHVMEPSARDLYAIRNQLEHRYLKVHEAHSPLPTKPTAKDRIWIDNLAYSIQRQDFEAKTLRVLRHARAGLVYLSLAMHREERYRATGKDQTSTVPMRLDSWEDDWKR